MQPTVNNELKKKRRNAVFKNCNKENTTIFSIRIHVDMRDELSEVAYSMRENFLKKRKTKIK